MKTEKLWDLLVKLAANRIGENRVNANKPVAPGLAGGANKPLGSLSSEVGVPVKPVDMTQHLTGNPGLAIAKPTSSPLSSSLNTPKANPVVASSNPGTNAANYPSVGPGKPVTPVQAFSRFSKLAADLNRVTPYSNTEINTELQTQRAPRRDGSAGILDFNSSNIKGNVVPAVPASSAVPQQKTNFNLSNLVGKFGRKANAVGVVGNLLQGNVYDAAKGIATKEIPIVGLANRAGNVAGRLMGKDYTGAALEAAGGIVPVLPDAIGAGRDMLKGMDEQIEQGKKFEARNKIVQGSVKEYRNTGIADVDGNTFVNSDDTILLDKLGFEVSNYNSLEKSAEVSDLYSYIEKIAGIPKAVAKAVDKDESFSGSFLKDMGYSVPKGYEVRGDLCCPVEKTGVEIKESALKTVKERVRVVLPYEGKYILERLKNPKYPDNLDKRRHIGGGIEAGETPAQAAARELHEELGIKVEPSDFKHIGKFDNQHYLLLPEHNIKPGKYKASVGSDPFIHLEHGMPSGADYMGPDVHKLMKTAAAGKPGLWANIRAKKARGEKAAKPGIEKFRKLPSVLHYNHSEHELEPLIKKLQGLFQKTAARRIPKVKLNQPLLPGLEAWTKKQTFNHAEQALAEGRISAAHRDKIVSGKLADELRPSFDALIEHIRNTEAGIKKSSAETPAYSSNSQISSGINATNANPIKTPGSAAILDFPLKNTTPPKLPAYTPNTEKPVTGPATYLESLPVLGHFIGPPARLAEGDPVGAGLGLAVDGLAFSPGGLGAAGLLTAASKVRDMSHYLDRKADIAKKHSLSNQIVRG